MERLDGTVKPIFPPYLTKYKVNVNMMDKAFFTLEEALERLNIGKTSLWRKLKKKRTNLIKSGKILESKGKQKTLYHVSIIEDIENGTDRGNSFKDNHKATEENIKKDFGTVRMIVERLDGTVGTDKKNSFDTNIKQDLKENFKKDNGTVGTVAERLDGTVDNAESLKKDIIFLQEKLKDKNVLLDNYKEDITEHKIIIKNKDSHISELTSFISDLTNRHDTIIMTMSKQLESLNEKLLFIEDRTTKPDGFFKRYGPTINQALIFLILVIIYIKILLI